MPNRRAIAWVGLLVLGVVAALAGPTLVARWSASSTGLGPDRGSIHVDVFPAPESCRYLLLVARRPERRYLDDPTPHRNSRVALYERSKSGWQRVTEPLAIRSQTTADGMPLEDDGTPSPGSRIYGYTSVPLGVFTLAQGVWRDGITPAFQISDWGRFDGQIGLQQPQVLHQVIVSLDRETGEFTTTNSIVRTSLGKSGSWIHYTHTERWSHGDSNGCMNLFRPLEYANTDHPYRVFLDWFESRRLAPGPDGDLLPLAVVPYELVRQVGTEDGMSEQLAEDFLDRVRPLQGRQMEDLQ